MNKILLVSYLVLWQKLKVWSSQTRTKPAFFISNVQLLFIPKEMSVFGCSLFLIQPSAFRGVLLLLFHLPWLSGFMFMLSKRGCTWIRLHGRTPPAHLPSAGSPLCGCSTYAAVDLPTVTVIFLRCFAEPGPEKRWKTRIFPTARNMISADEEVWSEDSVSYSSL